MGWLGDAASGAWDFINSDGGGAIIGAAAGALANDGSGQTTTTTTNQTMPDYLQPYTTGQGGVYPLAQSTYLRNMAQGYQGMTPEQQALSQQEMSRVQGSNLAGSLNELGGQIMGGQFDPNLAGLSGLNMGDQYAGMGGLDPTGALQQALSGQPNMDVLGDMNQANIDRSMQGYQDMTDMAARSFTEQINPAIKQGAQVAGQYGGSRQQMAQGMAARDIGEQMNKSAANLTQSAMGYGNELYGNAYQQAQAQQAGTGMALSNQAQQVGQYNTDFGLMKAITAPQTALQNRITGAQTLGLGEATAGEQFKNLYGLQGLGQQNNQNEQQFMWDQLANYGGMIDGQPNVASTTTSPGMSDLAAAGYGMQIGQGVAGINWGANGSQPNTYNNTTGVR